MVFDSKRQKIDCKNNINTIQQYTKPVIKLWSISNNERSISS